MKKIFFIVFTVFALSACTYFKCEQVNLPKEEVKWFSRYKEKNYLYFADTLGNIDTLYVNRAYANYTQCNRFELGEYQYESRGIRMECLNKKWSNSSYGTLYVNYRMGLNDYIKTWQVYNLSSYRSSGVEDSTYLIYSPYYQTEIPCARFSIQNGAETLSSINRINSFYWSEEYGLIAYEYFRGEMYYWSR